jgi:hypothetical protein
VQEINESGLRQASCSFVFICMTSMSVSFHSIQEMILHATAIAAAHPLSASKQFQNVNALFK